MMRITDLIGGLVDDVTHVVDVTHTDRPLLPAVAAGLDVTEVVLDDPGDGWPLGGDETVVALVAVDDEDQIAPRVSTVLDAADAHDGDVVVALLLTSAAGELPIDALMASVDRHRLRVLRAEELDHSTIGVGVVLRAGGDDEDRVGAQLLLERLATRALVARARTAGDAVRALAAGERELARREERIELLTAEVGDLRARLRRCSDEQTAGRERHEQEVEALRARIDDLESSTSYRVGHGLIRLAKDPSLVRRVPAKLKGLRR